MKYFETVFNTEISSLLRKGSDFFRYSLLNFTSQKLIRCSKKFNIKITVMNIERTEFLAWMERIMERFDILKEQTISNQSKFIEIDGEVLLENQDVLQLI